MPFNLVPFIIFSIFIVFLSFAGYRDSGKDIDGDKYLIKQKQERIQKELVVKERLGEIVDKDVLLTNSNGEPFVLKDIFNKKNDIAWVVVFVYFRCPKLCGTVLDSLVEVLAELKTKRAGRDYRMLTVSIDPSDSYQDAKSYKQRLIEGYTNKYNLENRKRKFAINEKDWIFAVGSKEQVAKFSKQEIGFPYFYNEKINEFEHPANFFILTSEGKISRYFYGIKFNSFDLNLSIAEAKLDKYRSTLDKIMLYCYRFDSSKEGGYVLQAFFIMKIFGLVTFILLLLFLGYLVLSRKKVKGNS